MKKYTLSLHATNIVNITPIKHEHTPAHNFDWATVLHKNLIMMTSSHKLYSISLWVPCTRDDYATKFESRIATLESPYYKRRRKIFGCVLVFCVTISLSTSRTGSSKAILPWAFSGRSGQGLFRKWFWGEMQNQVVNDGVLMRLI
jgi:hypothetical protein